MWERIRSMIIKEFIQVFRDPRMRSILLVIPLFQALIFGYAVTTDVKNIGTAIYDRDNSVASRALIAALERSGYFTIEEYVSTPERANELLDNGKILALIQIDEGYDKALATGKTAKIQAIIDGTDGNSALIIQTDIAKVVRQLSQKIAVNNKVNLESRSWFNENLESRNYYFPGIISTILTLITLTMTSMSIVREKEVGTMEQIMVTPIRKFEFICGKSIPFILIAFFNVCVIVSVAAFWFEVPIRGSLPLLFLAVSLYLLTILGIGFFISTISRTQQQAMMATFFFYFPMVLLSGFLFPIANMPEVIQWATYLNPLRYFITIIRFLFLKGVGLEILWPQILALAMMGLFTLWQATRRFQKTLT